MSRVFVCGRCQGQIHRYVAAPAPETCLYCHSPEIAELCSVPRTLSPTTPLAFACERGETCTRQTGGHCPGGKGC